MKIAIAGASGEMGMAVCQVVRERGNEVVELNRADYEKANLKNKLMGTTGVIIVFGPRPPYKDVFCRETTEKIVRVMRELRIMRLICQTGAMIGEYRANRSWWLQQMVEMFRKNNPLGYADRVGQEEVVRKSGLDWTIVKPPRLTKGEGEVREAGEQVRVGMMSSVSRVGLSRWMIRQVEKLDLVGQTIFVKG